MTIVMQIFIVVYAIIITASIAFNLYKKAKSGKLDIGKELKTSLKIYDIVEKSTTYECFVAAMLEAAKAGTFNKELLETESYLRKLEPRLSNKINKKDITKIMETIKNAVNSK